MGFAEVLDAVLDAVVDAVENAVGVDIAEYVDWLAEHEVVGLAARDVAGFVAAVHAVVGFVDVDDVVEFVDVDTVDIVDIVDDDVVVDDGGDKVAVVVHAEMLLWRNLEMDREPSVDSLLKSMLLKSRL